MISFRSRISRTNQFSDKTQSPLPTCNVAMISSPAFSRNTPLRRTLTYPRYRGCRSYFRSQAEDAHITSPITARRDCSFGFCPNRNCELRPRRFEMKHRQRNIPYIVPRLKLPQLVPQKDAHQALTAPSICHGSSPRPLPRCFKLQCRLKTSKAGWPLDSPRR